MPNVNKLCTLCGGTIPVGEDFCPKCTSGVQSIMHDKTGVQDNSDMKVTQNTEEVLTNRLRLIRRIYLLSIVLFIVGGALSFVNPTTITLILSQRLMELLALLGMLIVVVSLIIHIPIFWGVGLRWIKKTPVIATILGITQSTLFLGIIILIVGYAGGKNLYWAFLIVAGILFFVSLVLRVNMEQT